jgi:hypothetical protein
MVTIRNWVQICNYNIDYMDGKYNNLTYKHLVATRVRGSKSKVGLGWFKWWRTEWTKMVVRCVFGFVKKR